MTLLDTAKDYFKAGWHPLELPAHQKSPPPDGRTGREGIDMTLPEVLSGSWSGNIGLRMPVDVIGLDVDVYRGGRDALDDLLAKCGALPNTWISHSGRNDGSGIRFFRVQVGLTWVSALPGIDIIQRGHRYAAVYPSMHPDGRQYGWWDQAEQAPTDDLPEVESLPELPWSWVTELSQPDATASTSRAVSDEAATAFVDAHDTAELPRWGAKFLERFLERVKGGYSRHDTMQHVLIWSMECARAGIVAARPTLVQLGELWVESVRPDARRAELDSDHRVTEFQAMLRHAIGRVEVKTQADIDKLHDEVVGVPMNVPPSPASGVIDDYQPPLEVGPIPLITFRDLPDPFVIPRLTWHAENLLCRDTHGELAGAEKSMKSYLGLAIDVGLAAGKDVLDYFPVEERQRVLVLIGEGGEGPFLRRLAEVCHGYGITPSDLRGWLRYTTDHASAGSIRFLDGIKHELDTWGPSLVHADPWYTYQPSATESSQLTSVGYALDAVGEVCRGGGATALINHHYNRMGNSGLRQITGAGHAEWVDSWLLTSHREAPDLTNGRFKLHLEAGSRQWGGGAYDVDLTITPTLGQMSWRVGVATAGPASTFDPLTDVKLELLRIGHQTRNPLVPLTRSTWVARVTKRRQDGFAAFDELVNEGGIVEVGTTRSGTHTVPTYEVAP